MTQQDEGYEKKRIERLEKLVEGGNGGTGLIINFTRLETKVDTMEGKICDLIEGLKILSGDLRNEVKDLSIFMHKQNSAKTTKEIVLEQVLKKRELVWRNVKWICWFVAFLAFGIAGIFISLR